MTYESDLFSARKDSNRSASEAFRTTLEGLNTLWVKKPDASGTVVVDMEQTRQAREKYVEKHSLAIKAKSADMVLREDDQGLLVCVPEK